MNVTIQNLFWTFVIVTTALFGIVAITAKSQEVKLNRFLDNAGAVYETSCILDNATLSRIIEMGHQQGFYGSFLEIYNVPPTFGGSSSADFSLSYGFRDIMYLELRYPTIEEWAKITQLLGVRGHVPRSEKKAAFKYLVCQKPDW